MGGRLATGGSSQCAPIDTANLQSCLPEVVPLVPEGKGQCRARARSQAGSKACKVQGIYERLVKHTAGAE